MALPPLPKAVAFLMRHAAIGFGLATLLMLALFRANPGGVADVLRHAPGHPWPALLLWFFCGLTLGAVQIAVAVMLQDRPPDDDDHGGGPRELLPAPVVMGRGG
ncbi:hypothetical protein [Paracraurococcus lichenis]|uniref:DUF1049 domain-containing protein n=1 Tax=Paracraurococcus lichenis TaxID=3064888 RepID=A0ABT9E0I0_9PROT|nr:hypothetical protein [Paracraurococcus sp. LOR1-02]MDO9709515.1 hypothetical protein [Paracraurococcus sp. LOR1-02]